MLNVNSLQPKPPVGRSEYGRIKVALPKGKGLMDWVRLSTTKVLCFFISTYYQAFQILAKIRLPTVDHEELMKHNTVEDCWVHLFGQVYDVTSYLEFHPGGIPELMRAAGRDANALFNQYHAWVNYESMLKSCLVGRFSGDLSKLPPTGPSTVDETVNTAKLEPIDGIKLPQIASQNVGVNIKIESDTLAISSTEWKSLFTNNIVYGLNQKDSQLRVLVRHFGLPAVEIIYESVGKELLSTKVILSVEENVVRLKFTELDRELADFLDNSQRTIRKRPTVKYHECVIESVRNISHDTVLFVVNTPIGLHLPISLGHHVSIKAKKGLVTVYRPYTPVGHKLPSEDQQNGRLIFLIKIYSDGTFTPLLKNLKPGDKMEISDPIGDKNIKEWIGGNDLIMLAAGTGITPMIPIIEERLNGSEKRTELFFFNKTETDIVEDDWAPIRWDDSQIKVHHILSKPSSDWSGLSGRISFDHLPTLSEETKVLICGPDGFIEKAVSILDAKGVSASSIHIFKG